MKQLMMMMTVAAALAAVAKPRHPIQEFPKEVNGRVIDSYWQEVDLDWGYKEEQQDIFLVERPVPAKEGPGRPLLVVLHSSGHTALRALLCTVAPDNHDIYQSPDDFYALFLDCRINKKEDWWWGYGNQSGWGFELSPCEKRMLATIDFVVEKYGIDRDRIYLCGNSMGASGCLGFGLRHGNLFAAIKANVPALTDHACDRMGFDGLVPDDKLKLPDPPVLVNHTAPNDMRWSRGQEKLIRMMHDRKYAFLDYWADHKHCNKNSIILSKVDIVHSFDWLHVKKSDMYAVFTDASTDTPSPWPNDRERPGAGQINGFFRWADGADSEKEASIKVFIADLTSQHFVIPSESTATVSFRRLKNLKPKAGDVFAWSFGGKSGEVTVGKDGLVTVPGLVITKAAQELKVVRK